MLYKHFEKTIKIDIFNTKLKSTIKTTRTTLLTCFHYTLLLSEILAYPLMVLLIY